MLLATNRIKFKLLAVIVAIALIAPMVIMPVGAAQAEEKWFEEKEIIYLDAEIKATKGQAIRIYIDGQKRPIVIKRAELKYAYVDGQRVSQ